ncbi:hypothetical protein BN871_BF_00220 [Paenibacillus sp. P22]|nr:hypothetical protein BN871_BF_00220 [Paenibacillus sp. P22]
MLHALKYPWFLVDVFIGTNPMIDRRLENDKRADDCKTVFSAYFAASAAEAPCKTVFSAYLAASIAEAPCKTVFSAYLAASVAEAPCKTVFFCLFGCFRFRSSM